MNKQEELYFKALSQDRSESADMLEKPSMRGIKNSVVEKYSDQAHFIYELLQNADDAKATNARFILEKNRLIFAHNGTRHFSVTNPADEDRDSQEGTLGDINSITSIANSNKTEASIGKFGVGFKAVFQYTSNHSGKRMETHHIPCPFRKHTNISQKVNHSDIAKNPYIRYSKFYGGLICGGPLWGTDEKICGGHLYLSLLSITSSGSNHPIDTKRTRYLQSLTVDTSLFSCY